MIQLSSQNGVPSLLVRCDGCDACDDLGPVTDFLDCIEGGRHDGWWLNLQGVDFALDALGWPASGAYCRQCAKRME